MFAFVDVIVDFYRNCSRRFSPTGPGWKVWRLSWQILYSGPCKVVLSGHFFLCSIFFFWSWWLFHTLLPMRVAVVLFLNCIIIDYNQILTLISQRPLQFLHLPNLYSHLFRPHQRLQPPTLPVLFWMPFTLTHLSSVLFAKWVTFSEPWGLLTSLIWRPFSRDPPYKMWCYDCGNYWWANMVLFDVLISSIYHTTYSACQTRANKPLLMWASWGLQKVVFSVYLVAPRLHSGELNGDFTLAPSYLIPNLQ